MKPVHCLALLTGPLGVGMLCAGLWADGGTTTSPLRTELIALQPKYVVGHPMKFQITLKNTGLVPTTFGLGAITVNGDKFIIQRPDGEKAPYTRTREAMPLFLMKTSIDAGETKTLVEERDIHADYLIDLPGVYTVQFRGVGIPPSNIVKMTVTPNQEEIQASTNTVGFSSVFTDMRKDCQLAPPKPGGGLARDLVCKGTGGYNLYIAYNTAGVSLTILNGGPADIFAPLVDQGPDYNQRLVEWRLANGQPFAVIYRAYDYDALDKVGHPAFDKKYKTGESLLIRGLRGYEGINTSIDAKKHNAEQEALTLADTAYQRLSSGTPASSIH